jgi:hypothetical protein
MADFEDFNDAERISQEPMFGPISSHKVWDRGAVLASCVQTFETKILAEEESFAGLPVRFSVVVVIVVFPSFQLLSRACSRAPFRQCAASTEKLEETFRGNPGFLLNARSAHGRGNSDPQRRSSNH